MAQLIKRTTATGESRYDVRTRIGGRVVTKTFRRRRDADSYAISIEADKLRGVVVDPRTGQVLFGEYAKAWLHQQHHLADRTVELYSYLLGHYTLPTFGKTTLAGIEPSRIRSWHARLAADHPTTAAKAYRLLSQIMRIAAADEVIARNPCQVKGASQEKAGERPVANLAGIPRPRRSARAMDARWR